MNTDFNVARYSEAPMATVTVYTTLTHTSKACPAGYLNCPENAKVTTTVVTTKPNYTTVVLASSQDSLSRNLAAPKGHGSADYSSPAVAKPVAPAHSSSPAAVAAPVESNHFNAPSKPNSPDYAAPAAFEKSSSSSSTAPVGPTNSIAATAATIGSVNTTVSSTGYGAQFTGGALKLGYSSVAMIGGLIAVLLF
jgi:hypothetical protein